MGYYAGRFGPLDSMMIQKQNVALSVVRETRGMC